MNEDYCDMCKGNKSFLEKECVYCNGTGEWNFAAQAYMSNHICQCIIFDRNNCPVCEKKCHHATTLNPKQTIDPGYGGMSHSFTNEKSNEIIII